MLIDTTRAMLLQRIFAALAVLTLLAIGMDARAQVQFEDVSEEVGLTGFTESWGANFGDLNGDNCLDIFVQGHRDYPRVYRNTCTGVFEDIATQMDDGTWMDKPADDKHGGGFGDFDNDGDEDIILGVSVSGPGQLWVNLGDGTFDEQAGSRGLTSDYAARIANWMDFNNDGNLDALQMGLDPRSYARYQTPFGTFSSDINTGHDCDEGDINYIQMLDITGDGTLEFVCVQRGSFPFRAYDTSTLPFTDVTAQLPSFGNVNGTIIGDFDGNLRTDILMTRGATRPAGAAQVNGTRVEAWIEKDPGDPPRTGFRFQSGGALTVTVWSRDLSRNQDPHVMNVPFGGSQCSDPSDYRVCAEYNGGQSRWEVFMGGDGGQSYVIVQSTAPITALANVGESNRDLPIEPRLYLNTAGGFNYNTSMGLNIPLNCGGGAAADFDNDMDIDLYLSCGRGPENLPNRMYINQGNGSFVRQNSFGGEGPTGIGFDFGVAENVTYGDYDLDGFLDLFVTNGLLYYPWGIGGPDILLRNSGNANHWIQLDLVGVASNRDGLGAKVYATAGGVQQFREQNGGYNRWGQNQQWIHFGLAGNTTVDLEIHWPSGAVDIHEDVAADALYAATEGGGLVPQSQGPEVTTILEPGDECGEPDYDFDFGPANLLWRDCGTDTWHFRSKGGRANPPQLITQGEIVADAPFSGVAGFDLNGSDTVDNSTPEEIAFDIGVSGINDQGFDFNTSGQTSSCLDFSRQDFDDLIIGESGKQVKMPLDLVTMFECGVAPPPDLTISNASAPEEDGVLEFTVSLSTILASDVTFDASTLDGSATSFSGDYTALNNEPFVIPAGDLSTTVTVIIGSDLVAETDEQFEVLLVNVTNARAAADSAVGTIINDDGALPELSIADAEGFEDSGGVDLVITLDKPAFEDITFTVLTAGQTASYLSDYEAIINEDFTIPAGEVTLIIPLVFNADTDIEDDEYLLVGLSNFSNNVNPVDDTAEVYILDDDADPVRDVSIADVSANEDTGILSFTVSLSGTLTEDVTFQASTADGTATTSDADYTALVNQPGTITAGDLSTTVSVVLGVDVTPEPDETLTLTLSNVSANGNVVDGVAIGTILDDDTLPDVSIGDASADEDSGSLVFTVSLNDAAVADVTFEASTADGTATTADSDYVALAGQLGTITAGNLSTTVTVLLGTDDIVEPDEDFTVTLGNLSANANLLDGAATGTINNDDSPPALSIGDAQENEDTGTMSFTVSLDKAAAADVTFDASTADGTATTADSDYTALTNQGGTITVGTLSTTVTVLTGVDSTPEGDENFFVNLSNLSANATFADSQAVGTILEDDDMPELSIADVSAAEDTGVLLFTVSLNTAAAANVTFDASTADGTATTADSDYVALVSERGTILAGDLFTTVTVLVGVDSAIEADETLSVSLTNVSANVTVVDGTAEGTIENDDASIPDLSIADAEALEDSGSLSFTVSLSELAAADVTFNASTADDTATVADGDYSSLANAPFTITAGNLSTTVNVTLGSDSTVEPDETFTVMLSNVSANAFVTDNMATGTIQNDDSPLPGLSIADASEDEDNGTIAFTVSLSEAAASDVTFEASTTDGTATTADNDYTALFNEGGTITAGNLSTTVIVSLTGDSNVEPDETFTVELSNVSPNVDVFDASAIGTIENDDALGGPSIVEIDDWFGVSGGVSVAGNQVSYDGSTPQGWNSGAFSAPLEDFGFTDEYEVRFTIQGNPNNTIWVAGLGIAESSSDFRDIDFGLRSSNGQLTIYENGTWRFSGSTLADGDEISIFVSGSSIEYRLNGSPVYNSTAPGAPSFYVDTAFKVGSIALDVVAEGDAGPVGPPDNTAITSWVNQSGGVSATGNDLFFSGTPSNWTNSINSAPLSSLGAGDTFTVSWQVDSNPNDTIWVVGLGVTETDTQRTDIDYGLRSSNGTLQIRENGIWVANIGPMQVGDVLGIRVVGTLLEYQLNGIGIGFTSITGTEEFYIDTAFKSGSISLGSFTLTE